MLTIKDSTQICSKDWGKGQPIVFCHGWPLGCDSWESQMFFAASNGRKRSSQPCDGNEMDTYADDHGLPAPWIVADIVRIENGVLAEHWDVIQDEATKEQSKSGLPMFGDQFPKEGRTK